MGYILAEGESLAEAETPEPEAGDAEAQPQPTVGEKVSRPGKASPRAKRRARELGVDIAEVPSSGDLVSVEDVEAFAAGGEGKDSPDEATRVPVTGVRAVIMQRMAESSAQTAPVTLTREVDATKLVEARDRLNARHGDELGFRISYNDLLISLATRALQEFDYMNARLEGDHIVSDPGIHIGIAVDTDRGLLVPVVKDCANRDVIAIARELRGLVERAQGGRSLTEDLEGGTFTITNLGAYGIDAFTPIINLPQTAILGVGRIILKPAVHDGSIQMRRMMFLSLTFDHRLVDGAPAARFLARLVEHIEAY
jgi:pyruvate dehydrogenase E2 component (dihydrolipoamide acetyltransferase)